MLDFQKVRYILSALNKKDKFKMNKDTRIARFMEMPKTSENVMEYDIRVCRGPKRDSSIEEIDGITIFKVFFSDSFEFKKAHTFVTDCIIDGMSARKIFELVKKKNFALQTQISKDIKKTKEKADYKIRKIFGAYHISYTK